MIETEKLTKYYGDRAAVREMTFNVEKGEIVGLLGPNGAGKTTTMRMLTGYLPASSGKAIVAGFDVAEKPMEVRKRLGYLPETVPLYTDMPVRNYLDFLAKIRGVPSKGRRRRIDEVLELCQIADVENKIIGKLSRGYRQRVGLAQAIVHNPQVIILDEPTVGLDPRQIIEIRKVIRDLAGNHSMILSTHILSEVSALCDRVIIVNRGRVLVEDTLANLERRETKGERLQLEVRAPADELKELFGTIPLIESFDLMTETDLEEGEETEKVQNEVQNFDLKIKPGEDAREALAAAIVGRGWGLLELRTIAPSLEEIFVRLITEDLARLEEEEAAEAEAVETAASADSGADRRLSPRTRRVAGDDELEVLDEPELEEEAVTTLEKVEQATEAKIIPGRTDSSNSSKKKSVKPLVQSRKAAPAFLTDKATKDEDEEMDSPEAEMEIETAELEEIADNADNADKDNDRRKK